MVMRGGAENDGYNALVLTAGLLWRDVALIRTISRFLRQIRVPYSQDYMWTTLRKHAGDRGADRRAVPRPLRSAARRRRRRASRAKPSIVADDRDRAGRRSTASTRTASCATSSTRCRRRCAPISISSTSDGQPKAQIAIKFDSRKLDGLPLPRPLYEIFVYSPRVEGVHLRFGKVARGGIRWSDRPQDFRTEVLGLVKAQQVKNAVIVPVGAKGGFVPKQLPTARTREAIQAEGVADLQAVHLDACSTSPTIIGPDGAIVPPRQRRAPRRRRSLSRGRRRQGHRDVLRHRQRHFDRARLLARRRLRLRRLGRLRPQEDGHHRARRLGSRSSAISARWTSTSARRRSRRSGVGDMSGDVFGNGMLREKTTKLLAAFDHRDIFIDPDPDPEKSFAERAAAVRSAALELAGLRQGADLQGRRRVSARRRRRSRCRRRRRQLLGLARTRSTPQEVMKRDPQGAGRSAVLRRHRHLCARLDRNRRRRSATAPTTPIRITGAELRCKVIGEGANLGMTQRGRIEAALRGVRLNTDAIDNSAGVNTSDVEVNIKIALSAPVRDGALTLEARNALLAEMTDEVARARAAQQLSADAGALAGAAARAGGPRLPAAADADAGSSAASSTARSNSCPTTWRSPSGASATQPLTRPELAVLLAYAKLSLYSDLLDIDGAGRSLSRRASSAAISRSRSSSASRTRCEQHRLRREIIATQLANSMINRGGAVADRCASPTRPARRRPRSPRRSPRCATATA